METLEVVQALTRRREENRRTRHAAHGQRGTATRVAIQLRQDNAREPDAITEGRRSRDRVLADHGIKDEHDLVGAHGVADGDRLVHHLLVNTEAAGRINDDHVNATLASELDAASRDLDGVTDTVAGLGRPHLHTGAFADNLQLLDSVGALEIGGDEEDGLTLLAQPLAELARQRGLTGTLETREHEDRGTRLGEGQLTRRATEDLDEFLVNDGDDLLAGVESLGAGRAVGLFTHLRGELTNDGERDIGVDKRATNVGNRVIDVRLGQDAAAAQAAEGLGQAI